MDFRLSEEQEFIRDTVRRFIARKCPREAARELDERGAFPAELLRQLAETGFCGLNNPEEYGGAGRGLLGSVVVVEELATICPPLAGAFSRVALWGGKVLSEWGSEEQQRAFLPGIAGGSLLFTGAVAESSPDGGATGAGASAVRLGDEFILNGEIAHVPLAREAHFVLTPARVELGADPNAVTSMLVVDAASPGIRLTETPKIGFRGAGLWRMAFEAVRVPASGVLGGVASLGRGREQCQSLLAIEQVETAAIGLGIAQGAFDYAARYAKERVQFGQAIVRFEAIQQMLVGMAVEVRATRHLLYEACWRADGGEAFGLEAATAKLYAVDTARKVALQGLHVLGGYGFMMEYDAQRYVRDSLALLAGSEPMEALKSSVGGLMGLG